MTSIFSRLSLLGFASINGALDAVEDSKLMTLPVAKQRKRNLEDQIAVADKGITAAIARIRILNKEQAGRTARISYLTNVINNIMGDGDDSNNSTARPKLVEKKTLVATSEKAAEQLATQAATKGILEEAKQLLDSRLQEMQARIQYLEDTTQQADAQEEAANALKETRKILDLDSAGALDSGLRKAEQRQTEAAVSLEREMDALRQVTGKADINVEIDAELAEIAKNLKAGKPAA